MSRQQVPNYELASDASRVNLLTNGGFEIWQRGNGPFAGNSVWTADKWFQTFAAGDTLNTSANGGVAAQIPHTLRGAQLVYTRSTGGTSLAQTIKDAEHPLHGKPLSLSMIVYANVPNAIQIYLQTSGTGGSLTASAYHPGDGTWRTLTVTTASVPLDATQVSSGVILNASGTFFIDNAMLVVGSVPADYAPLHPADDLARCLRYYEAVTDGGDGLYPRVMGIATAGSQFADMSLPFKVRKAVAPTITKNGTWSATNCGQPAISSSGPNGVLVEITSTAAGLFYAAPTGASTTLIAESNP